MLGHRLLKSQYSLLVFRRNVFKGQGVASCDERRFELPTKLSNHQVSRLTKRALDSGDCCARGVQHTLQAVKHFAKRGFRHFPALGANPSRPPGVNANRWTVP